MNVLPSALQVKCVDLHPTEPWVLSALYSGNVYLWDTETSSLVKSWEVLSSFIDSWSQLRRRCVSFRYVPANLSLDALSSFAHLVRNSVTC